MNCKVLTFVILLLSVTGFSQEMGCEIVGVNLNPKLGWFPPLTLDTLKGAKTISDINHRFRAAWIAQYLAVEVSTNCDGLVRKASSNDQTLTKEQLDLLRSSETGCSVDVIVNYIPENVLDYNPPRQMNFSLSVFALYQAKFPGGQEQLDTYLKEAIIDKVHAANDGPIALAEVSFNINPEGHVTDSKMTTSSGNKNIDRLILDGLCNMPAWKPAENAAGQQITQAFELNIGTDMFRCDYYQY